MTEILATVSQYGLYSIITDMAENQSIDAIVPELTDNYGEAMAEAIELLTRDQLVAGTQVQYASTATSRATVGSGMRLSMTELRRAKRTLLKQNAQTVEDGNYIVYTHPDAIYDLEGDSTIVNFFQYAGPRDGSKTAKVLDLLKRPGGATAKELMKATGWQPHSVRGFLSGTVGKKMKLTVVSTSDEGGERNCAIKA